MKTIMLGLCALALAGCSMSLPNDQVARMNAEYWCIDNELDMYVLVNGANAYGNKANDPGVGPTIVAGILEADDFCPE